MSHTAEEERVVYLVKYRVTWNRAGEDRSRTNTCIVDASQMSRPGDPEQRDTLLRTMLAIRDLPGASHPDNVVLQDVVPVCNCEPFPSEGNCRYAKQGGQRFFLTPSRVSGFETVMDNHDDTPLGHVSNTLSVELLTLVRNKYDHQ